jgi:hypothetical protein
MNSSEDISPRKQLKLGKKKLEPYQSKKEMSQVKKPQQLISSYHELDSSPIHSEFIMEVSSQRKPHPSE